MSGNAEAAPAHKDGGPKIGDVMSLMPGHKAVFRGEWCMGCPVYETVYPEIGENPSSFMLLMKKLGGPKTEQPRDVVDPIG